VASENLLGSSVGVEHGAADARTNGAGMKKNQRRGPHGRGQIPPRRDVYVLGRHLSRWKEEIRLPY